MVGERKVGLQSLGGCFKLGLGLLLLLGLGPWPSRDAAAEPSSGGDRKIFEAFAAELLEQIDEADGVVAEGRGTGIAIWPFSDKTAPLPAEVANEYNARLLAALVRRSGNRHRFVARETLGALVDEVREIHGDEDELDAALSALLRTAQAQILIVGKLRLAGDASAVASYRAVRVEDGTIVAATAPRRVSLPPVSHFASTTEAGPTKPRPSPGAGAPLPDPRVIEGLQRDLRSLGYDPGPIDGRLGPRTLAAIRAYQAETGIGVDGRVTADLVDGLRRSAEAKVVTPPPAVETPVLGRRVVGYDPRRPYCREYQRAVWIGGRKSEVYGTACLQPDGSWQIVD